MHLVVSFRCPNVSRQRNVEASRVELPTPPLPFLVLLHLIDSTRLLLQFHNNSLQAMVVSDDVVGGVLISHFPGDFKKTNMLLRAMFLLAMALLGFLL